MNLSEKYLHKGICANGNWVYGSVVCEDEDIYIHSKTAEGYTNYKVNPETVCPFIGLCDCNKTKIFGGDIVRYQTGGCDAFYIVEQIKGVWVFRSIKSDSVPNKMEGILFAPDKHITVIGNIHKDNAIILKHDIDEFLKTYIAEPSRDGENDV